MIDTNKLLSNRSGGSTTLSRKSVINIGLIREDVIKIDGLLKSRLVLSKVRDGIERQSLERLRRKSREDDLEIDDDRDDNNRRRDPDPKSKKGRGLIGFLIGGALAVIGGIAMKFLPTILSIGKFIGKIAKIFTFVVGGAFTAIGSFISLFNDESKKLKGLDKDQLGESYINDVFTNFNGAITNVVLGIIAAAGSAAIVRAFMTRRMMSDAGMRDLLQEAGRDARRGKKQLTDEELLKAAAKKLGLNINVDKPVTTPFTKGKRGRPRKTLLEIMADIDERNPTKPGQFTGKPVPLNQKVKKIKKPKPTLKKTVVRKPQRPIGDPFAFMSQDIFTGRGRTSGTFDVKITADTIFPAKKILPQINIGDIPGLDAKGVTIINDAINRYNNAPGAISKGVRSATLNSYLKSAGLTEDELLKFFSGDKNVAMMRGFTVQNQKTQRPQAGGRSKIKPENFFEDPRGGPGAMKINKALLKQRGGIAKILSNIGGDAFVQTFKQGLKGSIGVIPILGDVFGFLLDYFVFGEPIGRAAFKAIGSFALSSLIGAVGLALGGPIGAFLGGVIGGIGGDILGGIAYDLFFGTDGGVSAKSSATKGVVKGAATQTFEDGGYVGEPSFKPLVNSVDKSTNLRTTPSYARGGGRVKFMPLPIPIPTKGQSQEEEEQLSMTSNTIETKTFAGLYER